MPLIHTIYPQIDGIPLSIGLWHIQEPEAYFWTNLVLSPEELAVIQHKKSHKQRLQSLAARAALTHVVGTDAFHGLITEHERPRMCGNSAHVSLSHSFPYACALLCPQRVVAIDCESYQQDRSMKTYTRFMNPREMEWYLAFPTLPRFLFLWSAKEALYKLYNHPQTHLSFKYHMNLYLPHQWPILPENDSLTSTVWFNHQQYSTTLHFVHFPNLQLIVFYCIL